MLAFDLGVFGSEAEKLLKLSVDDPEHPEYASIGFMDNAARLLLFQEPIRGSESSVTLPREVAKQVATIARKRRLSDNRVLLELIEQGIEARKQKEKAFFDLAERFRASSDPRQIKALGDELGRFVFGE